ncbi:MAG: hypothetical protein ACRDHL_00870 [Candidatus Promineifilaceae bacterium]
MPAGRWLAFCVLTLGLVGCLPEGVGGPAACNEDGALFADPFDDPERECGWSLYQRSGATAEIAEGELRLSTSQPGQIWWANAGRNFDDVVISVEAIQVSGPDDNAYGVICRYQSPENFYVFLVSGDGYYAVGKYQSGRAEIEYLSGEGQYQFDERINQGAASNDLQVSCIGGDLLLNVNGATLAEVSDPTFVTGDIGLAASTFEPGASVIAFDDLRVTVP